MTSLFTIWKSHATIIKTRTRLAQLVCDSPDSLRKETNICDLNFHWNRYKQEEKLKLTYTRPALNWSQILPTIPPHNIKMKLENLKAINLTQFNWHVTSSLGYNHAIPVKNLDFYQILLIKSIKGLVEKVFDWENNNNIKWQKSKSILVLSAFLV